MLTSGEKSYYRGDMPARIASKVPSIIDAKLNLEADLIADEAGNEHGLRLKRDTPNKQASEKRPWPPHPPQGQGNKRHQKGRTAEQQVPVSQDRPEPFTPEEIGSGPAHRCMLHFVTYTSIRQRVEHERGSVTYVPLTSTFFHRVHLPSASYS